MMQLEDYGAVVSDSGQVLKIFDFVSLYGEAEELVKGMQQLRPQVLMLRTRAESHPEPVYLRITGAPLPTIEKGLEDFRDFSWLPSARTCWRKARKSNRLNIGWKRSARAGR